MLIDSKTNCFFPCSCVARAKPLATSLVTNPSAFVPLRVFSFPFAARYGTSNEKNQANRNTKTILRLKTTLSGEVFKEPFIDVFHTDLEQVAFSLSGEVGGFATKKPTKTIETKRSWFQKDFSTRWVRTISNLSGKGVCPNAPCPFLPRQGKKGHGALGQTPLPQKKVFLNRFKIEVPTKRVKKIGRKKVFFVKKNDKTMHLLCKPKGSIIFIKKMIDPKKPMIDNSFLLCTKGASHTMPSLFFGRKNCKKQYLTKIFATTSNLVKGKKQSKKISLHHPRKAEQNDLLRSKAIFPFFPRPVGASRGTSTVSFCSYGPGKGQSAALYPRKEKAGEEHVLYKKIGDFLSSGDKIGHLLSNLHFACLPASAPACRARSCVGARQAGATMGHGLGMARTKRHTLCHTPQQSKRFVRKPPVSVPPLLVVPCRPHSRSKNTPEKSKNDCKNSGTLQKMPRKKSCTPIVLNTSGRVITISKTQLTIQKTQNVLFYNSANLHIKKGEWVKEGSPILTLTHQTLITGDIVQGIPRIEQLFEAFTSPPSTFKDRRVEKFKDVHDTLHSQVRDIFRKHWLKSVLPIAVRKSLEEIQYILVESIQKVYLSQGVLIADKHIEIVIRQIASKGQILDSGTTGLFLEEILPIRHIENANLTTPGKKCLYVPSVVGLTVGALSSDSFISAASFQETTRVLSIDAVVGKTDFLRGLKEKVVIGDLISAGTGLDIYFIYTTMLAR